jgi:hypothetical protein
MVHKLKYFEEDVCKVGLKNGSLNKAEQAGGIFVGQLSSKLDNE